MNRAKELHLKQTVVDAHFDLPMEIYDRNQVGEKDIIKNDYLKTWQNAGINLVVCAIFIEDMYLPDMALKMALLQIAGLIEDVSSCEGKVVIIKSKKDLSEVISENKIGIIISLEGLEPIEDRLELLSIFYEIGVRGIGLTWSRRNHAADGSTFGKDDEGAQGGLTKFGVKVLRKCKELGMLVDVSHLNDVGFEDVVKFSENPFIASHSNVRNIANNKRNLTDEQIKAIANKDGVIGIAAVKTINHMKIDEPDCIGILCDHIQYMINLVGAEHVGFGLDLCDEVYRYSLKYKESPYKINAIENHEGLIAITAELLKRKIKEEDIILVLGQNFINIWNKILK